MKKRLACILAGLIVATLCVISVYSNCPPTWTVTSETSQGCPYPYKSKTWRINWQDGNTSTKSNEAFGKCYSGWFSTTECAPVFAEPNTFPITIQGRAHQEWSQTHMIENMTGSAKMTVTVRLE